MIAIPRNNKQKQQKNGGKSVKAKQTRTKAVQCSWQIETTSRLLLQSSSTFGLALIYLFAT